MSLLEEENRQYREMLAPMDDDTVPRRLKLDPGERALLSLLLRRGEVTHEAAAIVSTSKPEGSTVGSVKTRVSRLRSKLAKAGILNGDLAIDSVHGLGYRIRDLKSARAAIERLKNA